MSFVLRVLAVCSLALNVAECAKPNIVFMLADDIGFNDLSYTGCANTKTSFLDELASKESLMLFHNYAAKVCSPSRAAFLTGRYPSTLGLQNLVFNQQYPVSLTRQVSTLADEFKNAGYSTHLVGKWHLGFQAWEYTPRYRGFDTFAGFYSGYTTYFTHELNVELHDSEQFAYYDLREGEQESRDAIEDEVYGVWWERDKTIDLLSQLKDASDPFFLFLSWQASHAPNDAPQEYIDLYNKVNVDDHRMYMQAQTHTLDDAINAVVTYMKDNALWDNTLLVFTSDNGGELNRGDNFPLRGHKNQSWEGGVRVPGFVTGGYLNDERRGQQLTDTIVHLTDWYPTLLAAAGIDMSHTRSTKLHNDAINTDTRFDNNGVGHIAVDGQNVWNAIQFGESNSAISTEERELLLDVNSEWCPFTSCGALRRGKWKFIRGGNVGTDGNAIGSEQWQHQFSLCGNRIDQRKWNILGCPADVESNAVSCHLDTTGCLFDLDADPCEYTNLADVYPDIATLMVERLDYYQAIAAPIMIKDDQQLPRETLDPQLVCDSDFWCPFQSYAEAEFEEVLAEWYRERFPVAAESEMHTVHGVFEGTDQREGVASGLTTVVAVAAAVTLAISLCVLLCVKMQHVAIGDASSNLKHETQPLIA